MPTVTVFRYVKSKPKILIIFVSANPFNMRGSAQLDRRQELNRCSERAELLLFPG